MDALANLVPAIVPTERVRLNAITANTNHAAFAVNVPDGTCARALAFKSALTCGGSRVAGGFYPQPRCPGCLGQRW